jgi:hypothetical protein
MAFDAAMFPCGEGAGRGGKALAEGTMQCFFFPVLFPGSGMIEGG